MPANTERDQKAMNVLLSRGLFNKEFGMRELVAVSSELAALADPGALAAWTLISKHYVYTGDESIQEKVGGGVIARPQEG